MKETELTIEELKELKHILTIYLMRCSLNNDPYIDGHYEEQLIQLSIKLCLMIWKKK